MTDTQLLSQSGLEETIKQAQAYHSAFKPRWKELSKYLLVRPAKDKHKELPTDQINLQPSTIALDAVMLITSLVWDNGIFQVQHRNPDIQEAFAEYYQTISNIINYELNNPETRFQQTLQQAIQQWSSFGTATVGLFALPENRFRVHSYHVLDYYLIKEKDKHGIVLQEGSNYKVMLRDGARGQYQLFSLNERYNTVEAPVAYQHTPIFTTINNQQHGTPYGMGWGLMASNSIKLASTIKYSAETNSVRAQLPPLLRISSESVISPGAAQSIRVSPLAVNHATAVPGVNFAPIVPFMNHDVPPSVFALLEKEQADIRAAYRIEQLQIESKTMTAQELQVRAAGRESLFAVIEDAFYNELLTPIISTVHNILDTSGAFRAAKQTMLGDAARDIPLSDIKIVYSSSITRQRALAAYTATINTLLPLVSNNPESLQAVDVVTLLRDALKAAGLENRYVLNNDQLQAKLASKQEAAAT
jgi:hypothetical protein